MHFSHLADATLKRQEPHNFDLDKARRKTQLRNERIAEHVVRKMALDGGFKISEKQVQKEIKKKTEIEIRSTAVIQFMDMWNHWRQFYFDLPPIRPKTKAQLTSIENAIQIVDENEINLTIFIACTHKAFVWRKVNPGFHDLIGRGLDYFEQHMDSVLTDIDHAAYMEDAGAL